MAYKILTILFLVALFFLISIVDITFPDNYFLSGILSNNIIQQIIFGIVIFMVGVKISNSNEKIYSFYSSIFLFLLGILALFNIISGNIFGFNLTDYDFGTTIIDFFDSLKYGIVILATSFGAIIFYLKRENIDSIEEEQNKEFEEEYKRKTEFGSKFPVISRIPVLGWIVGWMYKEGWKYSLFVISSIIISFSFMINGLGEFITRDEPRWINYFQENINPPSSLEESINGTFINDYYGRTVGYWDSYLQGEVVGTLGTSGGSGTTTSFLSFFGYFFQDSKIETYLFNSRITFVIHNILLLLFTYILISKLFNIKIATIFTIITALYPLFIGYSRIVNHDTINGIYIFLFFISFILGLKNNKSKYLIISGLFFGLSLLTSGKALFIFPLLLFMPIIYYIIYDKFPYINTYIKGFFISIIFYFLLTFILLPGIIYYPELLILNLTPDRLLLYNIILILFIYFIFIRRKKKFIFEIIKKLTKYIYPLLGFLIIGFFIFLYFNVELFLYNYSMLIQPNLYGSLIGSFSHLLYSIPDGLLFILIIGIILGIFGYNSNKEKIFLLLFFGLFLFFVVFGTKGEGYSIIFQKYIFLIIYFLILYISLILGKITRNNIIFMITGFILILNGLIINYNIHPFNIFYNNSLFPKGYILSHNNRGKGTYEAVKYIKNIEPDAKIWVAYGQGNRFIGKDYISYLYNTDYAIINWYYPQYFEDSDREYFNDILDYKNKSEFIHSIKVNGGNLVEIYKTKQ